MNFFKGKYLGLLILLIAAWLNTGFAFTADWTVYAVAFIVLLLLITFFSKYPEIGIYLIAFLFPFTDWQFIYQDINVPYGDLLALILFVAWIIRVVYLNFAKRQKILLPGLLFMALFVMSAVLSLFGVERELFLYSVKYIFRPIIFFYLMFIILPYNIIDTFSKFFKTLRVLFVLGVSISAMGIVSLFVTPLEGVKRVVPISIFGIYPLGTNHNLIAEVLVALIPFALILFWYEKDIFWRNIYLLGVLLMAGINLLTLSRAGWIALGLQVLMLMFFKYRRQTKKFLTSYALLLISIFIAPIIYLMYQLAVSNVITSSNLNRLKLIEVALNLFYQSPIIGKGIGVYTQILAQVKWYLIEYGGVLDAHGFVFKTLAETGIIGTIAFGILLYYIILVMYKAYKQNEYSQYSWLILGGLLVVVGSIVFQFFGTSYYIAKLWLPIGLALTSLKLCKIKFFNN